jgi:hypothetical protein
MSFKSKLKGLINIGKTRTKFICHFYFILFLTIIQYTLVITGTSIKLLKIR